MIKLLVTDKRSRFPFNLENVRVLSSAEYLSEFKPDSGETYRVFNVCQSYRYQSRGYYVSLLAEARQHHPVPSVKTLIDIQNVAVLKISSTALDALVQKSLRHLKGPDFELSIYFGKNLSAQYDRLCSEVYRQFRAPLLRVFFRKSADTWDIRRVRIIALSDIPQSHYPFLESMALEYFNKNHTAGAVRKVLPFDMAILVNPQEANPPSNQRALKKFVTAAEKQGFAVEFITKKDLPRIPEFNALFIRESTLVNHHTYLASRRAQSGGLVVVDDPESILKCTNKVYLQELLQSRNIATPRTLILQRKDVREVEQKIGFPCVVKIPDSAFSLGVKKAADLAALDLILSDFFAQSEMVLVQEYLPTDFDWRIGILEGKVLFVCKYFMARGHWQIYNWAGKKADQSGMTAAVALDEVPAFVLNTALKAVRLVGNGLYGVDIKEFSGKRAVVIEVNDNPSIDAGIEDALLRDELYDAIMEYFGRRVRERLSL